MIEVRNNEEKSRYEVLVDSGVVGYADYKVEGDVLTAPHTVVDKDQGGKGLAGKMVTQLLDDARDAGQSVIPECPYVAGFIGKNPEYLDLVPEDRRADFGLDK